MKNIFVFKLFMVLCIALQSVVLFPHHHHTDSEAICISITNCLDSHSDFRNHQGCTHHTQCDGHSMQSHSHDSGSGECSADQIVVIKPQNELTTNVTQSYLSSEIPSPVPFINCCDHSKGSISALKTMLSPSDPESIVIKYITKALPLRAPNTLS